MTAMTSIGPAIPHILMIVKEIASVSKNEPTSPSTSSSYYPDEFADKFDLDKRVWRKSLFHIDLSAHPALQARVCAKQQEIDERRQECLMHSAINKDVVNHALSTFL